MQSSHQNIQDYLPHRQPFVMIDSIRTEGESLAYSTLTVSAGNTLVSEGQLSAGGIVENMAQTAGAATGMRSITPGERPTMGYIGALKNLRVFALPAVGQVVETEIRFVHQVMNALIVEGTAKSEGSVLATCELKIFIDS